MSFFSYVVALSLSFGSPFVNLISHLQLLKTLANHAIQQAFKVKSWTEMVYISTRNLRNLLFRAKIGLVLYGIRYL